MPSYHDGKFWDDDGTELILKLGYRYTVNGRGEYTLEKIDDTELQALRLEVQELRQFCLSLLLNMRHVVLPERYCDDWWIQLGGYDKVEVD